MVKMVNCVVCITNILTQRIMEKGNPGTWNFCEGFLLFKGGASG
jgi:hypothetical protein